MKEEHCDCQNYSNIFLEREGDYYGASKCLKIERNGNDDLYLLRYLPECKCWVEKLWTELSRNIAKILGIGRCWKCR